MAKINIVKPTGSEILALLSAFKTENSTYVIFDSEKVGSMGLPIIYISKLVDKLEKINDDNEWQSVKNSLKGIINGTNFEYVKVADTINADEAFYTPLTLPQSSFDLIKSRYVVTDSGSSEAQVLEQPNNVSTPNVMEANQNIENNVTTPTPSVMSEFNTNVVNENVSSPVVSEAANNPTAENSSINQTPEVPKVDPVMPTVNAASNESYVATPNVMPEPISMPTTPVVEQNPIPSVPEVNNLPKEENNIKEEPIVKFDTNTFMQDKETFLKACENMFDALVSKYQKQLDDLERREQELKAKESEVQTKLNNANEHLANAEAREQVANIAHDNAQRVMDINNLMPNNPIVN